MSKRTSFRLPLLSHVWSKGHMPIRSRDGRDWIPVPDGYTGYQCPENVTQDSGDSEPTSPDLESAESSESTVYAESTESSESDVLSPLSLTPEYMLEAWQNAQAKPPPPAAAHYYLSGMKKLVMLCRELQVAAGDKPFFIACRHAADILGIDFRKASRWLGRLEIDGVLVRISTGKVGRSKNGKANEYRWGAD